MCKIGNERVLLAVKFNYGYPVLQLDAKVTFLKETLEDDVQVTTAQGRYEQDKNGKVLS